jgi:hypothetical protein
MAAAVAARLEEHRVHRWLGGDAGGERLDPLRTADIGKLPVRSAADHRVVRHVLRLVRGYGHTPPANARHSSVMTTLLPASEEPAISRPLTARMTQVVLTCE